MGEGEYGKEQIRGSERKVEGRNKCVGEKQEMTGR